MYVPKYYKVSDLEEIKEFIQHNSFATIVSIRKGKPIAAHIPVLLKKIEDDYYLTGHLAYGNPLWKTFEEVQDILVIFNGPHAYISSSWYEHENVPTWNYQAVHVYGKASLIEGIALEQDLTSLLEKYESFRENPVLWDKLSPELLQQEMKGIKGFKIKVEEVQAAYKLSQNRNASDYANIIKELYKEENPHADALAEAMKKNRSH
ncbi:FMN-binding negative transcriptional regulator [Lysinibacillus capsici]|uniref:FMN-binding negative transcriptional regulator n=1 Tax=Lysinibacillus TaxID=400634 RepID=UPI001B6648CB|nr:MULTISPECIES: FMN-binding negative transcriptional regulator [Lysinibacillus]MCR6522182.1 FMN-binding negative transcriptional regulator [Lysinibacillus capsici]MCT1538564.1 FMN-binding negative transcriptional regulator [Lysinibacillus capsici]MCT1569272.1 FMN-binding negative transcriptional regulator [Lysinibacillus capsici]MCT1646287.1 FMN-binding negative transcriptional regulator [Lysinibacillus capsici]MCT1725207.1 FMN-binding negative transcriptional regulator [Lysinibacillus capsic